MLASPDPDVPFDLATDPCGYGIGVVLLQQDKPVAFYSRTMNAAERNYVNHEQELLAAVSALKVFSCNLLGKHFTLVTDNKLNTYLEDSRHCLVNRLAGASTCSAFISPCCTNLAKLMLQTL